MLAELKAAPFPLNNIHFGIILPNIVVDMLPMQMFGSVKRSEEFS